MLVSKSDADVVQALLQIIADPDKAKAHLDQLLDQSNEVRAAIDQVAADRAEAEERKKEGLLEAKTLLADAEEGNRLADLKLTVHRSEVQKFSADAEAKRRELDDREGALLERQTLVAAAEQRNALLGNQLVGREKAVLVQEADLKERDERLSKTLSDAEDLKAQYERQVASLRAALDGGTPKAQQQYFMPAEAGSLASKLGK
jgi:hypothetical protein